MERQLETYQKIERSIIKKFRKQLWTPFIVAVKRYELIQAGDKIAVCISGGKDSMLMAKLLQELQRHSEVPFELVYLVMDPGYNEINRQKIESNAALLHIPITVFETNIFDVANNSDKSPCYLCARMRRGYLYRFAQELGRTDEIREWIAKAELRRARILQYCYDPEAKQFYDYDYVNGRRSDVLSGAVFALLYSGAVPREYAGDIVQALIPLRHRRLRGQALRLPLPVVLSQHVAPGLLLCGDGTGPLRIRQRGRTHCRQMDESGHRIVQDDGQPLGKVQCRQRKYRCERRICHARSLHGVDCRSLHIRIRLLL